jgi:hypothetical protein
MRGATSTRRLIEKGLREYSAEYRSGEITGLSNHLPMCLHALEELGASAARINRFYGWYVQRLEKRRVSGLERMAASRWQMRLGQHTANHEYFLLFARELERRTVADVLAEYLPVLIKGVGGGAFHPLIRLAYALEMDSRAEISEALASWCMAYLELGIPEFERHIGMRASAQSLAGDPHFRNADYTAGTIFLRMHRVASDPRFKASLAGFGPRTDGPLLAELATLSLHAFLSAPSVVTLHLATSTHALRILDTAIELPRRWIEYYWIAWLCAYVTLNAPPIAFAHTSGAARSWAELRRLAVAVDHDHINKFVYTCWRECERYDEPLYRYAAESYCNEVCRS